MAVEALSSEEIADMKKTASVFRMSPADFVRNAVREYIDQKKQEPFYRMKTIEVEEVDPEEAAEILALIDSMTEDDHEVVRADRLIMCPKYKQCPLCALQADPAR